MADFLDDTRRQIAARLHELKPLADEYQRLQGAAAALDGVSTASIEEPTAPRRRPAQPRDGHSAKRRGRPKGSGTRGREALELVTAHPGITIPQIADKMGIKQNYLYRLLPSLASDGLVSKHGRGWHPGAGRPSSADDAAVAPGFE